MKYNFDFLYLEIDKAASELKLSPLDALEIWYIGIEQWQKRTEHSVAADGEGQQFCHPKGAGSLSFKPLVKFFKALRHR